MNIALWIIAGVLAAAFVMAGLMKVSQPKEKLISSGLTWTEDFPPGVVKLIGTLEILAAIGLILPATLDIAPPLVPLAALGLITLMIGAVITHLRRKELQGVVIVGILLILSAIVVWGRFGPYAF